MAIDQKTRLLVCIGAAMAANCGSCFEHYHAKAKEAGIAADEINEALEAAASVKTGAHLALRNRINAVVKNGAEQQAPCGEAGAAGCCG
jgi:AhpD family alkylhydroperoxidase